MWLKKRIIKRIIPNPGSIDGDMHDVPICINPILQVSLLPQCHSNLTSYVEDNPRTAPRELKATWPDENSGVQSRLNHGRMQITRLIRNWKRYV
jgi:hypothetical protein